MNTDPKNLKLLAAIAVLLGAVLIYALAPELAATGLADLRELPSLDDF